MTSNEIRTRFLDFFSSRAHRVIPSSSLVPANDPTLLFSNAGMNQFKDVFLGRERRDYSRATTSQKCVRAGGKHNDLEQVGRTTRHHTFFEMLGNFSFGDYFKKEAIPWAWELITKDFAIPREKLYVTVFREDDEAEGIWAQDVRVPRDHIFRLDEHDNFWQMGDTGPCGPCSEIHYDLGPAASDQGHTDCKFPCDCGRYVELWNLVFMQFNRDEQGVMTPLPRPSIDTGAGLERLASVLQGKLSNFETDLFRPLIDEAAALANVEYGAIHDTDVSLRIIADHARASTFLISDGVLPSNEGRGYVLRLIMRRALYHGQTLGLNEPFLYKISSRVVDMMKDAYPELVQTAPHVSKAIKIEEHRYKQTTEVGVQQLHLTRPNLSDDALEIYRSTPIMLPGPIGNDSALSVFGNRPTLGIWITVCNSRHNEAHIRKMVNSGGAGIVPGPELFKLHDTFGLRPDFVEDIVKNYGLTIDREGYEAEMQKQRERARASWKGAEKKIASPVFLKLAEDGKTVFDGYTQTTSAECRIMALVQKGEPISEVKPGSEVEIVLDHTSFYAEAGGQVGDTGHFLAPATDHEVAHVLNTYYPVSGLIVHKAVAREWLRMGDLVTAVVDTERRDATRRNHTATHLLHAALRKTLGTHVKQAGSLVAPDRLRFDFTHYTGLGEQDLLDIEDLVNEQVLKNEEVVTTVLDLDTAVNAGAMALFGEKYADQVRVLTIDDFSKELCGGTHVRRTGDIGLFKIISEGSVAAGTRRIEALTGTGVLEYLRRQSQSLTQASEALRAKPGELIEAIEKLTESEKKLRKELEAQQMKRAVSAAGDLVQQAREVKGVRVVAARVEVTDRSAMRQMVDDLRVKLQSGVIVLGSVAEGRVSLIAAVTKDLTPRLDAGKIVKQAATYVEGSGGGRKDLAEAGGKNPAKLDESLQAVPGIIEQML
jgi:alanyl-tRNA synthetase